MYQLRTHTTKGLKEQNGQIATAYALYLSAPYAILKPCVPRQPI